MLMLKVLLVLGVLMVVCIVVCQPMLSNTIIVNPTPSPVPTPIPTPTPTSILIMEDTFAQMGVLTVRISNPLHIPEFGRWVDLSALSSPLVTPGDGYCTSNDGVRSAKIENISSYNPLTDTLLCDVYTTFPSTLTVNSYVRMFIGSPSNSVLMNINYVYTAGTMTVTIYQNFATVNTPLCYYQLPVLELDTELLFSLRMDPVGTVIVYRNGVPVSQGLILGIPRILPLIDSIQIEMYSESRLNYFAVTALRP